MGDRWEILFCMIFESRASCYSDVRRALRRGIPGVGVDRARQTQNKLFAIQKSAIGTPEICGMWRDERTYSCLGAFRAMKGVPIVFLTLVGAIYDKLAVTALPELLTRRVRALERSVSRKF